MFFKVDQKLYKINSDKGGFYEVYDSTLGRYLTLKNRFIGAHYSYKGLRKTYFYDLVQELKELKSTFNRALIFGLGSSTLQNLLSLNFPNIKITTIESDPTLLDINKYFFNKEGSSKETVILSDAFQFVKNSETTFDLHEKNDLVVIDFNLIGSEFFSEVFIGEAKNFLTKKGIFVVIFQRKNYLHNLELLKYVQRLGIYYNKVTLLYSKSKILGVLCSDN